MTAGAAPARPLSHRGIRGCARAWPALIALWLGAVAPAAEAAEMVVQGKVVEVVALGGARPGGHPDTHCQPPKPAAGGLVELLAWDLRAQCRARPGAVAGAGYRVYYRWDGRTYSQVMSEPPGETVSLRVRVQ